MRFSAVTACVFALASLAAATPILRRQAEGGDVTAPTVNGRYYKFSAEDQNGGKTLTQFEIDVSDIPSNVAALDLRVMGRDSRVPPTYSFGNAADFLPASGSFSRGIVFPEEVISRSGDWSYDFQVNYITLDCGSQQPQYTIGPVVSNITVIDGVGQ